MKSPNQFARDANGGVAITFALALIPVFATAGAATDYTYAMFKRSTLQRTADAAALAAATLRRAETPDVEQLARNFFSGNDYMGVTPTVTVTAETVTVAAAYSQPTFLMHLFGNEYTEIGVRATVRRAVPTPPCVLALDPTEKLGIYLNSSSELAMDCGAQANSRNSEAISVNSQSKIKSQETCAAGGWKGDSNAFAPSPTKCPPLPDPLAKLPAPAEAGGACTKTDLKIDKTATTLNPGVYCKNLTIDNGAVVTLQPGIYVIRDGQLKINSGSTLKGDNVLLFFVGTDARIQMG